MSAARCPLFVRHCGSFSWCSAAAFPPWINSSSHLIGCWIWRKVPVCSQQQKQGHFLWDTRVFCPKPTKNKVPLHLCCVRRTCSTGGGKRGWERQVGATFNTPFCGKFQTGGSTFFIPQLHWQRGAATRQFLWHFRSTENCCALMLTEKISAKKESWEEWRMNPSLSPV